MLSINTSLIKFNSYLLKNILFSLVIIILTINNNVANNQDISQTIVENLTTTTLKNAKVVNITDGDTITVEHLNKQYKIRFLGINTPEVYHNPPQPYSLQAKQYILKTIYKNYVDITYYNSLKTDKYNRILANVYKDSLWINKDLIEKGLAYVYIIGIHPNSNEVKELFTAEINAINNNINLWSLDIYKPISAEDTINHIGKYKIIIGKIKEVKKTNNTIWLELEDKNLEKIGSSFSIRINKKHFDNFNIKSIEQLIGKKITAHGFIERYSDKFAPYVDLQHPINLITH